MQDVCLSSTRVALEFYRAARDVILLYEAVVPVKVSAWKEVPQTENLPDMIPISFFFSKFSLAVLIQINIISQFKVVCAIFLSYL